MRHYATFPEALNELRRELKEMGILIHTKSVQNIDITNNPEYNSYEITNYTYRVLDAKSDDIPLHPQHRDWCHAELQERLSGKALNPGAAWRLREKYWKQFLKPDPFKATQQRFDYAYPERMSATLIRVIRALKQDNITRRAYLPIFEPLMDDVSNFNNRIPCSLGYWFVYRQGQLDITYLQRSADFSEHFRNDIWLANSLKDHVASETGLKPGHFVHWLGSLHIFAKDVEGVF